MPSPGSKKQSQRTKGNLKPSSSSQAAELLASSGVSCKGFIGFGNSSGSPYYVPAADTFEDVDSSLEPDLRVVLRKLSKKDSTTKVKALKEFIVLCKEKNDEALKAVLPYWPRIYGKMALDIDHRVRESTQQAMNTLASRVRRNLAPHLKKLMGCWLLCQYDTYPTVASAAQQAFDDAFSKAKQPEAIVFCIEEIIEYLVNNILNQRPETLSDTKITSPEDMENKYNRVITSSLLALRKLLEEAPDKKACFEENLKCLLQAGKFWKFAKSSVSQIKAAMYLFLAGLCQVLPGLCASFLNKLSLCILLNLDETDSVVCSSVWEAILCLVESLEGCWEHVNMQKAVWPKLRKLLQEGCNGNATSIGPNILPFFSKLLKQFPGDASKLNNIFFSSLKEGLHKERIQTSLSECSALVQVFMECAHYSIKFSLKQGEDIIAKRILLDQVIPVVEASVVESPSNLSKSPLYRMLGYLLLSLHAENHTSLESSAWQCLTEIMSNRLDSIQAESVVKNSRPDRLVNLIRSVTSPLKLSAEKTVKVKFSEDFSSAIPDSTAMNSAQNKFVNYAIRTAFLKAHEAQQDVDFLYIFSSLLRLHPSTEVVLTLLGESGLALKPVSFQEDVMQLFVFNIILPWIEKVQKIDLAKESISYLLSALFAVLPLLEANVLKCVLDRICENFTTSGLLKMFLTELLASRCDAEKINTWLRCPTLGYRLVTLTEDMCFQAVCGGEESTEDVQESWAVLALILSSADGKEPVLGMDPILKILQRIHSTLDLLGRNDSGNRADLAVKFVSKFTESFFNNLQKYAEESSARELLSMLFSISIDNRLNVSSQTLDEVCLAWMAGVRAIVQQGGDVMDADSFFVKACGDIRSKVTDRTTSAEEFNRLLVVVEKMLLTVASQLDKGWSDVAIVSLLQQLFVHPEARFISLELVNYIIINGHLTATCISSSAVWPQGHGCPISMLYGSLFNAKLLQLDEMKLAEQEDEAEDETHVETRLPQILQSLVYGLSICRFWKDMDSQAAEEYGLESGLAVLEDTVVKKVKQFNRKKQESFLKAILKRALEEGYFWATCLQELMSIYFKCNQQISTDAAAMMDSELTEASLQALQVAVQYAELSSLLNIAEFMAGKFVGSERDGILDVNGGLGALALLTSVTTKAIQLAGESWTDYWQLVEGVLLTVMTWREADFNLFILCNSIEEMPFERVVLNVEVMRFLELVTQYFCEKLGEAQWDFIMCSLVSWIQSVEESKEVLHTSLSTQIFCVSVCRLLVEVADSIKVNSEKLPSFPKNLTTEWLEFFSDGIYSVLLPLYIREVENCREEPLTHVDRQLLLSLGHAISHCPKEHFLLHHLVSSEPMAHSDSLKLLLDHFCSMVLSPHHSVQITAYLVLYSIMSELHQLEDESESQEDSLSERIKSFSSAFRFPIASEGNFNVGQSSLEASNTLVQDEDQGREPPRVFMRELLKSWEVANLYLEARDQTEQLHFSPNSVQYRAVLSCLLMWKLLLLLLRTASSEVRAEYVKYLDRLSLMDSFLTDLFCLIPRSLVSSQLVVKMDVSASILVELEPKLDPSEAPQKRLLQHLACTLYKDSLQTVPAMVRQWWRKQDRKFAYFVDNFTRMFISHSLCASEIQAVQSTDIQLNNITIRARPSTKEVVAVYSVEEVSIEMVISLPENYPLGNISMHGERRVGVSTAQWEKWLLQLNFFLQHQNGTIIDGLYLWKRNIDKKFEGVEDCMICFSVLHGTNFQLPSLQCKTCKKKFHSACLYKWFNTSHNSSCPLCRNPF